MKWEYNVVPVSTAYSDTENCFDDKGQDGWELVAVDEGIAYFKRPKIDVSTITPEWVQQTIAEYYGGKVG